AALGKEKADGFVFFDVRGAYLSRSPGVADKPLRLLGSAKGEPEKMTVVIRDFSQLFEPTDATYTADGGSFEEAAEKVFVKLCKAYPAGHMAVVMEKISNANIPLKDTVSYELDTATVWKDVKSVVWDPAVNYVVNMAGAC